MVSLNVRIGTFNWVWHEHCNALFNIRNLVSSLILMFVRICLRDSILYTWFGMKWKRLKKFWGWKTCLVYAHFFKHLNLSMLISFMLPKKKKKKRVYLYPIFPYSSKFSFNWDVNFPLFVFHPFLGTMLLSKFCSL